MVLTHRHTVLTALTIGIAISPQWAKARGSRCEIRQLRGDLEGFREQVCNIPPPAGPTVEKRTRYVKWLTENKVMAQRIVDCVAEHPEHVDELPLWSRAMVLAAVFPILFEGSGQTLDTTERASEVTAIWHSYLGSRGPLGTPPPVPDDCWDQLGNPIRRLVLTLDAYQVVAASERRELENELERMRSQQGELDARESDLRAEQDLLDELKGSGFYLSVELGTETSAFYGSASRRYIGALPALDAGVSWRPNAMVTSSFLVGTGFWPNSVKYGASGPLVMPWPSDGSLSIRGRFAVGSCLTPTCRWAMEVQVGLDLLPDWDTGDVASGWMNDYLVRSRYHILSDRSVAIYLGGGYRVVSAQVREFDNMSHGLAKVGLILEPSASWLKD